MLTFDRLQFYYFHRHNLSENSNILLSNVNVLAEDKGQLPQKFLRNCDVPLCNTIVKFYDDLKEGLDKKKEYTDSFILSRN